MSSIGKEMFMRAHEQLVEEYLERNPNADWTKAYEATADDAQERAQDNLADMIDAAHEEAKGKA